MIEKMPEEITVTYRKIKDYSKAENPGEIGALYEIMGANGGFKDWKFMGGPESSWNNDRESIKTNLNLMKGYDNKPTAVLSKHGRLTCKAYAETPEIAYVLARECHWKAALGNVTIVNRPCTITLAKLIGKDIQFVDGKKVSVNKYKDELQELGYVPNDMSSYQWTIKTDVAAFPRFDAGAIPILEEKQREKMRIWEIGPFSDYEYDITNGDGVAQIRPTPDYAKPIKREGMKIVSGDMSDGDIEIGFELTKALRPVCSNGVVLGGGTYRDGEVKELWCTSATEMYRSGAAHTAGYSAQFGYKRKEFDMMAHDGFPPEPDNIEEAAKFGVKKIFAPFGGMREKEVDQAARDRGISMLRFDERLFAHP